MSPPKYLIESLQLATECHSWLATDDTRPLDGKQVLGPLGPLNAFVGANNVGKSRLLRQLFRQGVGPGFVESAPHIAQAREIFHSIVSPAVLHLQGIQNGAVVPQSGNVNTPGAFFRLAAAAKGSTSADLLLFQGRGQLVVNDTQEVARDYLQMQNNLPPSLTSEQREEVRKAGAAIGEAHSQLVPILSGSYAVPAFAMVYVPVLRGLRPLHGDADVYGNRTHNDYFQHSQNAPDRTSRTLGPGESSKETITGLLLYHAIDAAKRGKPPQRRAMEAYEKFLGDAFFDGARIEIIAGIPEEAKTDRVLHVKVGDEREQPIYNLGDGLAQLIVMTLPIFLNRDKNLLLFIEEPEIHLHAGYQRLLIDALLNTPCDGSRQVFVSTHSHQFLDITLESDHVSVFHCQKELPPGESDDKQALTRVSARANRSLHVLRDLGVSNSSVMLVNCTIWVEGTTDRMYYRHLLNLYQEWAGSETQKFVEDLHYAFVEYGGSNITHWSFLDEESGTDVERLCGQLLLVADDDGVGAGEAKPAKKGRHEQLAEVLGERLVVLTCREVENLLSPEVIAAVVKEYEGPECELQAFDRASYRHEPLGLFIENCVLEPATKSRRPAKSGHPYADQDAGAIKDKVRFAERAIQHMKRWDDLTEDAKQLAIRMHTFIASHNKLSGSRSA